MLPMPVQEHNGISHTNSIYPKFFVLGPINTYMDQNTYTLHISQTNTHARTHTHDYI